MRGERILLPSPEEAAYPYTGEDRAEIAARSGGVLVGGPATVAGRLRAVLDGTGTGEPMITTPVYEHADRRRSCELVASIAGRLVGPADETARRQVGAGGHRDDG
ncbi:hypothetical protein ABGB18_26775 [Nonomuraea sp. B12E4]|uniref:hypothetical protein n=1 Tax=Nonomuraea sp. B12E4 TaxID=3153564 RepID=UPI00325D2314